MIRYIIIICISWTTFQAQAQIHNRSQKFIEAGVGILDGVSIGKHDNSGSWFKFNFGKYGKKEGVWQMGILGQVKYYQLEDQSLMPVQQYLLEATFSPKLFRSIDRKIYINPTIGPILGYELTKDREIDPSGKTRFSRFVVGSQLGFTGEWNFSEKTALILYGRGNILPSSKVQPTHFLFGIGIRFNFF